MDGKEGAENGCVSFNTHVSRFWPPLFVFLLFFFVFKVLCFRGVILRWQTKVLGVASQSASTPKALARG